MEVWNRSQYEVLKFELDGVNVLDAPLSVEQRVMVTGFADTQLVSFTRLRVDTGREMRVTSHSPLCVREGSTLLIFDQSFRLLFSP